MVDMLTWPKTQVQVTLLPGGVLFVVYYYSHILLLWDAIAIHHGFSFVHESGSFFFMQASIYVHALVSCRSSVLQLYTSRRDTIYVYALTLFVQC